MILRFSNLIVALFSINLICTSCFVDKDEIIKLPPRLPGDPEINIINNSIYNSQSYFNLESNEVVAFNDKTIWDLAFECSDTGWHIIINPATKARAAMAGNDFYAITGISGIPADAWKWDEASGCMDSSALSKILDHTKMFPQLTGNVYIIDRGYDENGNRLGYKKLSLNGLSQNQYEIKYANLNGEGETVVSIEKDPAYHFIAFSFNNGGEILRLEPEKNNWHLLFSQYTGYTPDDFNNYVPYFVQGVLLNRNGTMAVVDTLVYFSEIDYQYAFNLEYSANLDTIGHLWKDVTVNTETMESVYVCDTSRNHIIKTPSGEYYKFRFLDYYNGDGIKGFPSFEFQKL